MSDDLVAQLKTLAGDQGIRYRGFFFRSAKSGDQPMSGVHAWRIVTASSLRAAVHVDDGRGRLRLANARDFRHGAAVNQVQQGVPLSEVQQQLATPELTRQRSTQSWPTPSGVGWLTGIVAQPTQWDNRTSTTVGKSDNSATDIVFLEREGSGSWSPRSGAVLRSRTCIRSLPPQHRARLGQRSTSGGGLAGARAIRHDADADNS